jgi:2'-5' RNA ligase
MSAFSGVIWYNGNSEMRTFVALPVPPAGGPHRFLEACQRVLKNGRPDVKWVSPEHFHVTLRFLGEVTEEQLPAVEEAVRQAAASVAPFAVRLSGWGAFPNANRPQTFWAAVGEGAEPMRALERVLTDSLEAAGIAPDKKPFHPHVTLGRMRTPAGTPALKDSLSREPPSGEETTFTARHITLFESRLTPSGPIYSALLEAPFSGQG